MGWEGRAWKCQRIAFYLILYCRFNNDASVKSDIAAADNFVALSLSCSNGSPPSTNSWQKRQPTEDEFKFNAGRALGSGANRPSAASTHRGRHCEYWGGDACSPQEGSRLLLGGPVWRHSLNQADHPLIGQRRGCFHLPPFLILFKSDSVTIE